MTIIDPRGSTYTPANWYWRMDASTTQVWSSASAALVPLDDPAYLRWADRNTHIHDMTWPSLFDIMMTHNPSAAVAVAKLHPEKLKPIQVASALIQAGAEIQSTATPAINGTYTIDSAKLTSIAAGLAAGKGFPSGIPTITWFDMSGTPHSFTEADFLNFASAIEHYVYQVYMTEATLDAGHDATWPELPILIA
jgi:hypothetical protein